MIHLFWVGLIFGLSLSHPLKADDLILESSNSSDRSEALQSALDRSAETAIQLGGKLGRVKIPVTLKPGIYHLKRGLVIDPAHTILRCDGYCELDFSSLPPGKVALTVSPNTDPYRASGFTLENIRISGGFGNQMIPGRRGLSWQASNIAISNIEISGFETCEEFNHNAYLIAHYKTKFYWCKTAIHFPAGLKNAGENISYFGSEIFDSDNGLLSEATEGTSFNFFGCSFDYLGNWRAGGKHVTDDPATYFRLGGRTRVFLSGSHIEGWDFDTPPIQLSDLASWMMQGETFSSTVQPYQKTLALFHKDKRYLSLVTCENDRNQVSFQGVNFIRLPMDLSPTKGTPSLVSPECSLDIFGTQLSE